MTIKKFPGSSMSKIEMVDNQKERRRIVSDTLKRPPRRLQRHRGNSALHRELQNESNRVAVKVLTFFATSFAMFSCMREAARPLAGATMSIRHVMTR